MVIRTADHGELGLAHGTYRQKHFNVYKEALNVPMVFSNPGLWPRNQTSDALISHVDFVPTIARLIGTPRAAMAPWQGVDYSGIVTGGEVGLRTGLRRLHVRRPPDRIVRAQPAPQSAEAAQPHRGRWVLVY